jgi:hypothetical protein
MWPFGRKRVVDDDTAAWHRENFTWLIEQFGGGGALAKLQLVLPKPGYFPNDGEQGHALADRIFDQVKAYCGMADWPVDLVSDDNPLAERGRPSLVMVSPKKHAIGTFAVSGNRIQISYVPDLLNYPVRLIATLAHQLAHYLLATAREPPPCDDDETEFLTDLAAVYLGFGVFLANSRFAFEPLKDGPLEGWSMSSAGYLPEADLIFALALFIETKALDPEPALACLKPHLAKLLRRALRDGTARSVGAL